MTDRWQWVVCFAVSAMALTCFVVVAVGTEMGNPVACAVAICLFGLFLLACAALIVSLFAMLMKMCWEAVTAWGLQDDY